MLISQNFCIPLADSTKNFLKWFLKCKYFFTEGSTKLHQTISILKIFGSFWETHKVKSDTLQHFWKKILPQLSFWELFRFFKLQILSGKLFNWSILQNIGLKWFNPFHANVPFLYPLKTENHRFCGVFKGYRNGTLA